MSQDELFDSPNPREPAGQSLDGLSSSTPLAARMRPQCLSEYTGQSHILGPGKLLRRAIEADRIQSLIFFGPPGVGKTSLAKIIALTTKSPFESLSGVESNTSDMRRTLTGASNRFRTTGKPTLLFIDEIHRFNKSQQDVLLPDVESGSVRLIGATTHNPFFFVNSPLVSRSQIFELRSLSEADLIGLMQRAIADENKGLGMFPVRLDEAVLPFLAKVADGDARKALNALELSVLTTEPIQTGDIHITLEIAEECIQRKAVVYDRDGEGHYDTISAYIKSVRASDVDASLYWLAKMIHAGEDPRFITRRLIILASEDIGLADPMGLVLAVSAHQAAEYIGWPEARIPIAEATIFLAAAFKSNSSLMAIDAALEAVKQYPTIPVPKALRDGHYAGAEQLGNGVGYDYSHNHSGHFHPQDCLGMDLEFYKPGSLGVEQKIQDRIQPWREQIRQIRPKKATPDS